MAPLANPTRSSRSNYLVQRRHGQTTLPFTEPHGPVRQRGIHQFNVPERTRSRALAEVTLVDRVAEAAIRRSLSFSEYSEHYEHRAGTRISGSVSDAAPTVLDWEIGG